MSLDIFMHEDRKSEHDSLVATAGRGRHQQFSIRKLVARSEPLSLVDETLDFFDCPSMLTKRWHGHKLLGWPGLSQLGMENHV